eukprot:scaffold1648_cov115-Cylindrotheca_fusiformis.AAC.8
METFVSHRHVVSLYIHTQRFYQERVHPRYWKNSRTSYGFIAKLTHVYNDGGHKWYAGFQLQGGDASGT